MDMFKALFDLPDNYKHESEKSEAVKTYFTFLNNRCFCMDNLEGEDKILSIVADISYESLSYTPDLTYIDDGLTPTEEDLRTYRQKKSELV